MSNPQTVSLAQIETTLRQEGFTALKRLRAQYYRGVIRGVSLDQIEDAYVRVHGSIPVVQQEMPAGASGFALALRWAGAARKK